MTRAERPGIAAELRVTTAFHEAGHAVAAYVLLGPPCILQVELHPHPNRRRGGLKAYGTCWIAWSDKTDPAFGWHVLAGPVAAELCGETLGFRRHRWYWEDIALASTSLTVTPKKMAEISGWVASEPVWQWVELVANALLSRGKLSRADLDDLLATMDRAAMMPMALELDRLIAAIERAPGLEARS